MIHQPRTAGKVHPMRHVREIVVQSLYQLLIDPTSLAVLDKRSVECMKPEIFIQYLEGSIQRAEMGQVAITDKLSDKQWDRLHCIEQAIMLLVYYELSECHTTPYRVVINEAVELAKKYGGEASHKLIHGLADKLAVDLRNLEVELVRKKIREDRDA